MTLSVTWCRPLLLQCFFFFKEFNTVVWGFVFMSWQHLLCSSSGGIKQMIDAFYFNWPHSPCRNTLQSLWQVRSVHLIRCFCLTAKTHIVTSEIESDEKQNILFWNESRVMNKLDLHDVSALWCLREPHDDGHKCQCVDANPVMGQVTFYPRWCNTPCLPCLGKC